MENTCDIIILFTDGLRYFVGCFIHNLNFANGHDNLKSIIKMSSVMNSKLAFTILPAAARVILLTTFVIYSRVQGS